MIDNIINRLLELQDYLREMSNDETIPYTDYEKLYESIDDIIDMLYKGENR